jgi:hypothetical protein
MEVKVLRRGGSLYRGRASSIHLLGALASFCKVSGCRAAGFQLAGKGKGDDDFSRFVCTVRR